VKRRAALRDDWLPYVLAGVGGISHGCQLMLVVMSTRMTSRGYVSWPRDELAAVLGVQPSQITKWTKEAIDAELLMRGGPAYKGHTAQFYAVRPSPKVTRNWSPLLPKVPMNWSPLIGHL
jgi:hypothetical protein